MFLKKHFSKFLKLGKAKYDHVSWSFVLVVLDKWVLAPSRLIGSNGACL